MVRTRQIPCADCDRESQSLVIKGFQVLGCIPDASAPSFCIISFQEQQVAGAVGAGGTSPPLSTPSTIAAVATVPPSVISSVMTHGVAGQFGGGSSSLTDTQVRTAQAIVNLFETGSVLGDYGKVTLISGDSGHLTYGRSQTTLGSGNLAKLLVAYCDNAGARFAMRLHPYLDRVTRKDLTLDTDVIFQNLLRACADDPVMRETQDRFFQAVYWEPAAKAAVKLGIVSPLGIGVVYDSYVHGSWTTVRDVTNNSHGAVNAIGERAWVAAYVAVRRAWLAGHRRPDLRATVYRMDAFQRLVEQGFWGLELPLVVRGAEISEATLHGTPPGCYDAPTPGSRPLSLTSPLARGLDVRLVQLALSDRGVNIVADGVYGQTSSNCIKTFQRENNLPATGIADISLIASLTA